MSTAPVSGSSTSATSAVPPVVDQPESSSLGIAGVIGAAVGGGALLLILLGTVCFVRRHRRRKKRRLSQLDATDPHEKAQLHSDDVKPDLKELSGGKVPQAMLEKHTTLSELPANAEVIRQGAILDEMPSNEPPGQEMETTENEMWELDRLAGTTHVSNQTTSTDNVA